MSEQTLPPEVRASFKKVLERIFDNEVFVLLMLTERGLGELPALRVPTFRSLCKELEVNPNRLGASARFLRKVGMLDKDLGIYRLTPLGLHLGKALATGTSASGPIRGMKDRPASFMLKLMAGAMRYASHQGWKNSRTGIDPGATLEQANKAAEKNGLQGPELKLALDQVAAQGLGFWAGERFHMLNVQPITAA